MAVEAAVLIRPTVVNAAAHAVAAGMADAVVARVELKEVAAGVVASNVLLHRSEEQAEGESTYVVRLDGHKPRLPRCH